MRLPPIQFCSKRKSVVCSRVRSQACLVMRGFQPIVMSGLFNHYSCEKGNKLSSYLCALPMSRLDPDSPLNPVIGTCMTMNANGFQILPHLPLRMQSTYKTPLCSFMDLFHDLNLERKPTSTLPNPPSTIKSAHHTNHSPEAFDVTTVCDGSSCTWQTGKLTVLDAIPRDLQTHRLW